MGMGGVADFGGGFGGRGGDFGGPGGAGFGGPGGGMAARMRGGVGGIPGGGGAGVGGGGGGGGRAAAGGPAGAGGGGRGGGGIGGGPGGGGGSAVPAVAALAADAAASASWDCRRTRRPGGAHEFQSGRQRLSATTAGIRAMMYTGSLNITEANSLLNAQGFSLSGVNVGQPYANRTNVTGSVGGPLNIPKLFTNNSGQFQLNFTVSRSRNGSESALTTMPSEAERQGNFEGVQETNGATAVIYNPTTCTATGCIPFPNNQIPNCPPGGPYVACINPIAQQLLKFYPFPNLPGQNGIRNYEVPSTPLSSTNSLNSRVNQTINAKNRIMVSLAWQGINGTTPNSLLLQDPYNNATIVDSSSGSGLNAGTTYSHNFTTRLINSLAFTWSRQSQLATPYFSGLENVEQLLGIGGVATDPLNWGPPGISFTNYGGLSDRTASLVRQQTGSATESLIWVHGKHTLTFGGGFRRQHWDTQNNSNPRGNFTFNGDATSNYINGVPVPNTGLDFADFLLGVPDTAAVQCAGGGSTNLCNGNPSYYFRGDVISAYVTGRFSPGAALLHQPRRAVGLPDAGERTA